MSWIVQNLWLIAALPILAGALISVMPQRQRFIAAGFAVGSMGCSLLLSIAAFARTLSMGHVESVCNFAWFQFGSEWIRLGWILNPLTAVMLVMVTFVGLLIFIYSTGYMAEDENFTRFFCFLSLFAGAMLGVIIANNLLLLFMCWEIVGLTSYLLIGFWYENPNAAAAAKKAFIVTRIGDLGFFLGMMWLYWQTGTLLFYDGGHGALEASSIAALSTHTTVLGLTLSSAIGILIFCGAAGKSGQLPLHVWLPDAMEGPTPVSALIHAATMVAAGVFLIARIYPLMSAASLPGAPSAALQVVTWIGALTALFGAMVAVAQWDIKRILAYSTVSQLGYMMIGLGTGGVSVGMFHLITHAFFKALLFLGAGSVIHGCAGEQDIRNMGGLRKEMPVTFAAYSCGMLALCGFPLFAGFWSKDEILHSAFAWNLSRMPFYIGALAALLTAFYMTRQMFYVYFGETRLVTNAHANHHGSHHAGVHESPAVMTGPLAILAVFAVGLGLVGTPVWPWFQSYLEGETASFHVAPLLSSAPLLIASSMIVLVGISLGWLLYGRHEIGNSAVSDPLEKAQPRLFDTLQSAFYINELYAATVLRLTNALAVLSCWLDRWVWGGVVRAVTSLISLLSKLDSTLDSHLINGGFDEACNGFSLSGRALSLLQNGQVQRYLGFIGAALVLGVVYLSWGTHP
jgi:NADH-quinone oxidoreductase subunit L